MKKLAAIVLAACIAVPVVTGCSTVTVPDITTSETTVKELEPARAQDDYFRFINQNNFDKSKFKAKYEELYAMFLKQIPSKKFSIS